MLTLTESLRDEIIAHARACYPQEACGILAGPQGTTTPTRYIPMANNAPPNTREWAYRFNATAQLAAYKNMDERGEDPLALVHSHTHTEAHPSAVDIACAAEPDAHYLIVSLKNPQQPVLRAWHIRDGHATEQPITAAR